MSFPVNMHSWRHQCIGDIPGNRINAFSSKSDDQNFVFCLLLCTKMVLRTPYTTEACILPSLISQLMKNRLELFTLITTLTKMHVADVSVFNLPLSLLGQALLRKGNHQILQWLFWFWSKGWSKGNHLCWYFDWFWSDGCHYPKWCCQSYPAGNCHPASFSVDAPGKDETKTTLFKHFIDPGPLNIGWLDLGPSCAQLTNKGAFDHFQ